MVPFAGDEGSPTDCQRRVCPRRGCIHYRALDCGTQSSTGMGRGFGSLAHSSRRVRRGEDGWGGGLIRISTRPPPQTQQLTVADVGGGRGKNGRWGPGVCLNLSPRPIAVPVRLRESQKWEMRTCWGCHMKRSSNQVRTK